jgi:threonylcarbamoyladenosine tRNA methylthiotransferase MtaB
MSKFFISTLGCRCNQADSAGIRTRLCGSNLHEAEDFRDADLIVINSCTVTRRADQQVRQTVRRLHRDNPEARIVVTGCYAERDPEILAAIPGVSLVLGNGDRDRLAEVWRDRHSPGAHILRTPLPAAGDSLSVNATQTGVKTRPFVKVQDGCDARCAYCIVPSVRGPGRSATPEDILREIHRLIGAGYQEIVLTGVHLGTYGRRLPHPVRLTDLLIRILEIPDLGRIRLSSIEPMDFDPSLAALAAEHRAFAHHFHMPLQSGSDRILRLMRRPYSAERFMYLLQEIKTNLPAAGIGTDVLVGFPGESDADFEATCEIVRQSPLAYLHVFPFSPREGTEAATMPGRVTPGVVRERCQIIREISAMKNLSFRQRFAGQVLPAISLANEEEMGESVALTGNYIHARIAGEAVPPNRLVNIRIDEVRRNITHATLTDSSKS